jgi:TrmH family RNA methyltransferase
MVGAFRLQPLLTSRDNPKVKHWAKLAADARYRREKRRALIEGPHLLAAALQAGHKPLAVLATEEAAGNSEIRDLIARAGMAPVMLSKAVFGAIADAGTPQGVAAEIALSEGARKTGDTVFLEGVQDPANVGAIIRSAAAFGLVQVVLDRACADPWSPKALRAGMGGHFELSVRRAESLAKELAAFRGTLVCSVPKGGQTLGEARLARPIGWLFGGEGAGLSEETIRRALVSVTIPMAGSTESLNVAAAAAVCFYEAFSRSGAGS